MDEETEPSVRWMPTCMPGLCYFVPRFDLRNPISIRVGLFGTWRRVHWSETYVRDVCERCGQTREREPSK